LKHIDGITSEYNVAITALSALTRGGGGGAGDEEERSIRLSPF